MDDAFMRLEKWYLDRCNGDWEHQWGITIETLDNPGWQLRIDLHETIGEYVPHDLTRLHRSEEDWIFWRVEKAQFSAGCGPQNLRETIDLFLHWFDSLAAR